MGRRGGGKRNKGKSREMEGVSAKKRKSGEGAKDGDE